MDDGVFGNKLDFQKYIEKRLLEITDLVQRRQLREILNSVFMGLYEHVEQEYQDLEKRILQEEENNSHVLAIQTSVIPRALYDATDEYLMPMDPADIEKLRIDRDTLTDRIERRLEYPLYRIMLEADYRIVKELEHEQRRLRGVLITDQGRLDATFKIEKDDYYLKMIERLYPIFVNNHLPWNSICAPYLNRMFQISLCSVEGWDPEAEIQEIKVEFEEYQKFVRDDCVPVWNVKSVGEKSSSYPEPCLDHVHYQHVVYKHRLEREADYLVASTEYPLKNVRRVNGDLIITCGEASPLKWRLYKLERPVQRSYPFPVFSNRFREKFSDLLYHHYQTEIKTKSELEHFITSLGYREQLEFSGYCLDEDPCAEAETYHLDYFIEDEFATTGRRMTMILTFVPTDADNYLNRDIMSYLVTQVQKRFPEYRCVGRLK